MAEEGTKVFEGLVDLNYKPFIDGLGKMEAAVSETATKIGQLLTQLEDGFKNLTVGSIVRAVANDMANLGKQSVATASNVAKANDAIATSNGKLAGTFQAASSQMQSSQRAWSAEIGKSSQQAAAGFDVTAERYQKLLRTITQGEIPDASKMLGLDLANLDVKIAEVQDRMRVLKEFISKDPENASAKLALSEMIQERTALMAERQQVQAVAKALIEEQKAGLGRVAAEEARSLKERERQYRDFLDDQIGAAKQMNDKQVQYLSDSMRDRVSVLEQAAKKQFDIVQQQTALASKLKLRLDSPGGLQSSEIAGIKQAYNEAVAAANSAKQEEESLARQLTATIKAERALQAEEAKRFAKAEATTAKEAADLAKEAARIAGETGVGVWGRIGNAVRSAGQEIQEVEKKYNSLFRGGAQIASVGTQLNMVGGQIRTVGTDLIQGAQDFDFWVARAEAAAISAGSVWEDKTSTLNQALQEAVFQLGDTIGSAEFAQLAEGFYVYQSAAGGTIDTMSDLKLAQAGLTEVYKAATITGDDYASTTRGVLQVVAEFGLGVEDMGRVTQILMNASQVTQTEFGDMIEAFKYLGPTFKEMGGSIEEAAALLAKLSDYGLKGSNAGRGLQMAIEAIASPTEATAAALQDLLGGLRGVDSSWREVLQPKGDLLTFLDQVNADGTVTKGVISELANAMKGMSEAQKFESLNAIFAQNNAARQMVPLIADQINMINGADSAQKRLAGSVDETVKVYQRMVSNGSDAKTITESLARAILPMTDANRQGVLDRILKLEPETGEATVSSIQATLKLLEEQELAAARSKMTVDELYASFKDGGEQVRLFDQQWEVINDTIKVRFGRATGDIKESLIKIGEAVAEVALPIVEKIGEVIKRFMTWAQANEETAKGLLKFIAVVGGLATVLGPLLMLFGGVIQGIAAIPVLLTAVSSGFGAIISILTPFGGGILAAVAALAALAGIVILVRKNWGGLGDTFDTFMGTTGQSLKVFLEGLMQLLLGLATFDGKLISGGLEQIGQSFLGLGKAIWDAIYEIGTNLGSWLGNALGGWLNDAGEALMSGFKQWGYNLIASLAEGMIAFATGQLDGILTSIANNIARFFRSFSPPKYGPLMGIYTWGRNLIQTFAEGMKAADLKDAEESAQLIVDAMSDSFKAGMSDGAWIDGAKLANEATMQMLAVVRNGGKVSEDFFDNLLPYLGRWKEEIVDVMMAYQEVYALERNIRLEEQKLEIIKAQREELDKQLEIKNDLFDQKVDPTGPAYYQAYKDEMVDPTTAEGQARIKMMKESLSKEDFQSWIAFQKKLWESKHKEEDFALKAQQDAAEAILSGYEAQLAVVQEQYDYYKAIYEYALKLANLGETDPTKKTGGGGGGGSSQDDDADMADLEAARRRMREIAGEDQAIKDENRLAEERGGPIGGIGGADEQRDREAERIKDIDAANRKQKAEFDARKIAAKGNEEELARIKREEEAWNTAYQEEKARLGERKRDTEDILEAGQELADVTAPERIDAKKAEYAEQIKESVGEQKTELETAEQIKARTGDLDKAAIDSQKQLRSEERQLSDLRDLNQEKQLDFEERLKDAAGDEEKIRKIKEEQDAWELAYKAALKLQEERTKAAREADQDINDEQRGIDKSTGGGGFDEGFGGGPALGGVGGIGSIGGIDYKKDSDGDSIPDFMDANPNDQDKQTGGGQVAQPYGPPVPPGYTPPVKPMTPLENTLTGSQNGAYDTTTGEIVGKDYGDKPGDFNFERGWDRIVNEGIIDSLNKYLMPSLQEAMAPKQALPANDNDGFVWNDQMAIAMGGQWAKSWVDGVSDAAPYEGVASTLMNNVSGAFSRIDKGELAAVDMAVVGTALDGLSKTYGQGFVDSMLGADGPFAMSNYTLAEVNGVWQRVLRDGEGNPTGISEQVVKDVSSAFYNAFTGENSPAATTNKALERIGSSFYVRLTGEGSPPATVDEMIDKVGENAYKLLSGDKAVPNTVDQMVSDIGSNMYKLLTGEDAPAKTSDEFVSNMADIFKDLGIEGPVPKDVQAGIDLIGKKLLEDLSPDGTLPDTVRQGIDIIGKDFLLKFSPTGELPTTVSGAMEILGNTFTRGMRGEGGLTSITNQAIDLIGDKYKGLLDGEGAPPQTTQLLADRVKQSYYDLSNDGPAQTSDEMLKKVAGFYKALDEDSPTGLPGIVKGTAEKIRNMYLNERDSETGFPALMRGMLDKIRGAVAEQKDGEGGLVNTFMLAVTTMAGYANEYWGSTGKIANSFGELAASMARAVLGIPKPPSGSTGSGGGAEQKEQVPSFADGTDGLPGSPTSSMLVRAHGQEPILSYMKGDAQLFKSLRQNGIWDGLKSAIISRDSLREQVERIRNPQAVLPALPTTDKRSLPSSRSSEIPNKYITQNNYITFTRSQKEQESRFLKKIGDQLNG